MIAEGSVRLQWVWQSARGTNWVLQGFDCYKRKRHWRQGNARWPESAKSIRLTTPSDTLVTGMRGGVGWGGFRRCSLLGCMMRAVQLHLNGRCIWVAIICNDSPFFAAMSSSSITIPVPGPTCLSANGCRRSNNVSFSKLISSSHIHTSWTTLLSSIIISSGHLTHAVWALGWKQQILYISVNYKEQNSEMCKLELLAKSCIELWLSHLKLLLDLIHPPFFKQGNCLKHVFLGETFGLIVF